MSDDTSNRPSRSVERPHDVTDPLLWQLAVDVLSAHEPDDEGHCRNLQCAGQGWPCAARTGAEQSLRLARSTPTSVELTVEEDSGPVGTGWPGEAVVPAPRWGWNAGPAASQRGPKASASAA
ncbi:hypothetical protein F8271_19105 [Micromonospora sp. ALFpr18c]|uniref:hypothetical protein n=1 Tax=unclassified Micromonospora TaxID=2617518 RepID=UPI00124B789A|nr:MULTISPECIES: hypothetical protein [unclassified Micromonospora]KAB1937460.1 hypothetical protein F8271_19105 [Micromonospora sp. ALFpr18c]MDG4758360.1 hypothetical protein [Micromonospora sp. WMMD710]